MPESTMRGARARVADPFGGESLAVRAVVRRYRSHFIPGPRVAVIALFFVVYLLPLGVRPLVSRDEVRYGGLAREMVVSGDWVVPRLAGVRYFEKPVLGYWLTAASVVVFGESAFAIRLPSALAAGLAALMIYWLTRRRLRDEVTALLAAGLYLTCPLVFALGTSCILDGILSLFLTGSLAFFYLAADTSARGPRCLWLTAAGACAGLAFLTKGFLAVAVPVAVVIPFLLWEKRHLDLLRMAWLPILSGVVITLPWCLAVAARESDFWHYFFWVEHIQRFASPARHSHHPRPFWFFVPVVAAGAFPWILLAPAAVLATIRKSGDRVPFIRRAVSWLRYPLAARSPFIRFTICWLVFPFLFFSASAGKLPTYILPCFAPLAILLAAGLREYCRSGASCGLRAGNRVIAGAFCLCAGMIVLSLTPVASAASFFGPEEGTRAGALIAGLLVGAILAWIGSRAQDGRRCLGWFAAATASVMLAVPFGMPIAGGMDTMPGPTLRKYADRVDARTVLVSDARTTAAACWFFKRDDCYFLLKTGEFDYGLQYQDARRRLLSLEAFDALIRAGEPGQHILLVVRNRTFEHYRARMPDPTFEVVEGGLWIAEFPRAEQATVPASSLLIGRCRTGVRDPGGVTPRLASCP